MAKTFQIVDVTSPPSLQTRQHLETDWNLSVICQDISSTDNLVCPGQSKRKYVGIGYTSLAKNLIKFNELNLLPKTLQLNRIDKGEGVETALISNNENDINHAGCSSITRNLREHKKNTRSR